MEWSGESIAAVVGAAAGAVGLRELGPRVLSMVSKRREAARADEALREERERSEQASYVEVSVQLATANATLADAAHRIEVLKREKADLQSQLAAKEAELAQSRERSADELASAMRLVIEEAEKRRKERP